MVLIIQELSSLLSMEAISFVTEDRKTPQESVSPNTYTFDLFGGVHVSDLKHLNMPFSLPSRIRGPSGV